MLTLCFSPINCVKVPWKSILLLVLIHQVFSTAGASLTAYVDRHKKNVCILSSVHREVTAKDPATRRPNTVTSYQSKCDVGVMDRTLRKRRVHSETTRWPVAVFYNMIDMAVLNAHVLYQTCKGKRERWIMFIIDLVHELADTHVTRWKAAKDALPSSRGKQKPSFPLRPGRCQVKRGCKNLTIAQCVGCSKFTCCSCSHSVP